MYVLHGIPADCIAATAQASPNACLLIGYWLSICFVRFLQPLAETQNSKTGLVETQTAKQV